MCDTCVIQQQADIAAFLAARNFADVKQRNTIRAYLVEFIKFRCMEKDMNARSTVYTGIKATGPNARERLALELAVALAKLRTSDADVIHLDVVGVSVEVAEDYVTLKVTA